MSGVFRGMLLGAGGALGLCSQSDNLNDVPRSLLRGALSGYDKISVHSSKNFDNSSNSNNPETPVNVELQKLNNQLLEIKSNSSKPVVIYGGNGSGITMYKVVVVGGVAVVVMYYAGYSFPKIMYATRENLKNAVTALESQISLVGTRLDKTKMEILTKLGFAEENLTAGMETLDQKLSSVNADLQENLAELQQQLDRMESVQNRVEAKVSGVEGFMSMLDTKFELNRAELRKLAVPIVLLVRSVVSMTSNGSGNLSIDKRNKQELKGFLEDFERENEAEKLGISDRIRKRIGEGLNLLAIGTSTAEKDE